MIQINKPSPLFPLGQTVATPGALEALASAGQNPKEFLDRHARGDWGSVGDEDWKGESRRLAGWGPIALGLSNVVGHRALVLPKIQLMCDSQMSREWHFLYCRDCYLPFSFSARVVSSPSTSFPSGSIRIVSYPGTPNRSSVVIDGSSNTGKGSSFPPHTCLTIGSNSRSTSAIDFISPLQSTQIARISNRSLWFLWSS